MTLVLESILNANVITKTENDKYIDEAKEDKTDFIMKLNDAFSCILSNTTTPSIVSTVLEISKKFSDKLNIDSAVITEGNILLL